ncbi:amidohydrolase family protein, partial [Candidatus Bathyarchaeota archaeon]|nr:amidohydrolase family protein [Candidatus Bathyarchaeota archaeon]
AQGFRGSVAVKGEKIVTVGKVKSSAETVVDAKGLAVTPGFIDVHNHGDLTIMYYPRADGFVRQGITTFVGGQCGNSPGPFGDWIGLPWALNEVHSDVAPRMYVSDWLQPRELINRRHMEVYGWEIDWHTLAEFFERLEKKGFSPNYVPMVGHGEVRSLVMGPDFQRHATRREVREMTAQVDQAMRQGCRGLTVGRDYDPGIWASFEEILACAKAAAKYGGVYQCHSLRTGHRKPRRPGEPAPVMTEGVLEAIDVGRKAKMPVEVSHLGVLYNVVPGDRPVMEAALAATLKIVDDARAEGLDVTFDEIPNHATGGISTNPWLASNLNPWLRVAGSLEQLVEALKMPDFRDEVKASMMAGKHYGLNPNINPNWAEQITIAECGDERFVDKTVAEAAEELGVDELEALMQVLMIDPEAKAIRKGGDDWSKLEFFKHPEAMIGIDTFAVDETYEGKAPAPSLPNENSFGGFPRYLRRAVRETGTLTLEEAIRKVTSSPARKFRLMDRGALKPGYYADIVVFDPKTVTDRGDQLEPRRYPEGIEHFIVNG